MAITAPAIITSSRSHPHRPSIILIKLTLTVLHLALIGAKPSRIMPMLLPLFNKSLLSFYYG
jgi:hypothetical protein